MKHFLILFVLIFSAFLFASCCTTKTPTPELWDRIEEPNLPQKEKQKREKILLKRLKHEQRQNQQTPGNNDL
ncbi:MAG: hypothetical protein WCS73_05275 [Lentisphaeria bacterium]